MQLEAKMIPLSFTDIQIIIAAAVFVLGFLLVLIGALVLISRGYSREIRALTAHTARLGQKGLAQEVTGLVNGATELVASINQLVRTASGIGIFLISLGIAMMSSGYWIIQQIDWVI
jgi:Trk-type K+ transport system membrane component